MLKELAVIILIFWSQSSVSHDAVLETPDLEVKTPASENSKVLSAGLKSNEKELNEKQSYSVPAFSQISVLDYNNFKVKSKAAIAVNMEAKTILYDKNIEKKLPVASLTKLMTALVILDEIDLNSRVIVSKNAVASEGDKGNLKAGEEITARNLLYLLLVNSSNDAAVALAEHISDSEEKFVGLMNAKTEELELKNTRFANATGLDKKDNYSTAYDLAKLINHALEKPLLWEIMRVQSLSVFSVDGKETHHLKNTNKLLGKLPGINIIGGKTGFTNQAEECLILVVSRPENNKRIICVILGSEDRFGEMEKLVNWAYSH